jgi:hypothetical protein
MALNKRQKERLEIALGDFASRNEDVKAIIAAVDSVLLESRADYVAPLGTTANLTALVPTPADIAASDFTAIDANDPTKAEIDAGIDVLKDAVESALDLKADNADVETLRTEAEARLDAIEAKIDAWLAKQVAAGQMEDS